MRHTLALGPARGPEHRQPRRANTSLGVDNKIASIKTTSASVCAKTSINIWKQLYCRRAPRVRSVANTRLRRDTVHGLCTGTVPPLTGPRPDASSVDHEASQLWRAGGTTWPNATSRRRGSNWSAASASKSSTAYRAQTTPASGLRWFMLWHGLPEAPYRRRRASAETGRYAHCQRDYAGSLRRTCTGTSSPPVHARFVGLPLLASARPYWGGASLIKSGSPERKLRNSGSKSSIAPIGRKTSLPLARGGLPMRRAAGGTVPPT
ncbi:uncharacterized protein B0H18DRAFT_953684 [Fomitopsis serialis]|uniref:uncharacterized protein n=1 Tax=Fomitopsis serialis TaxID=139415 RepID=UPI002007CC01|nr:uncharacterized protein B0H18DRAFT_953684 [Neoantrodia serialis]KAH9929214.1 hypothetical protein B0H18DRAFT_953684 [Neoantrodia serialis]